MFPFSWSQGWWSRQPRSKASAAPSRSCSFRPGLEVLENRAVPAASVLSVTPSSNPVNDDDVPTGFFLSVLYDQDMDTGTDPVVTLPEGAPKLSPNQGLAGTGWQADNKTFVVGYDVADCQCADNVNVDVEVDGAVDAGANPQAPFAIADLFTVDTANPKPTSVTPSIATIDDAAAAAGTFTLTVAFDEPMDTNIAPTLSFPTFGNDPTLGANPTLTFASGAWTDATTYVATFNVADVNSTMSAIDVRITGAHDARGNLQLEGVVNPFENLFFQVFHIATVEPRVTSIVLHKYQANVGLKFGFLKYRVTFSEAVEGVDLSDFTVSKTGGKMPVAVTKFVALSDTSYLVSVRVGRGIGRNIQLHLVDDNSIANAAGNALGGVDLGDGNFDGPIRKKLTRV